MSEQVTLEDANAVFNIERPSSKEAIVALFRVDIMHSNGVWIVGDDDDECTVVWNCVSPSTGKIESNRYCSTTFYKTAVDGRVGVCVNCSLFRHTGMEPSSGLPTCPHVCLQEDVMRALSAEADALLEDAFTKFLRCRFQESNEINVVRKSDKRLTLLVIADSDKCLKKNVRRVDSLVTFQRSGTDAVLFCSNVECKRKKITGKMKSPKDFCPHFDKVWSTPSMVQLIYNVIRIPIGCEAWGLGTGDEFEADGLYPSDAMFTSTSQLHQETEKSQNSSVRYDIVRFRYIPTVGVVSPIPLEPTENANLWSERWKLGEHVLRDTDGRLQWNSSGYLIGSKPCDIDESICNSQCLSCLSGIIKRQKTQVFKLYTSIGCVIRPQFIGLCNNPSKSFT